MKYMSEQELKLLIPASEVEVKAALDYIINFANDLPGFKGRGVDGGYMKAYGYLVDGQDPTQRPFDFAVNKGSIKCYIRSNGIKRLRAEGRVRITSAFPDATFKNGELRIDLFDAGEAERLLECLFPAAKTQA